ncbi:hypothetical protein JD844_023442 [Phrynosoma platyrhinos]|uniref:Uncharacterized protein n=1 Tax=Phrynosoma platyrhinos TaxID=52577 RepID=A0ABQ7SWK1_PHRPL|nr:hypothetical protein JD844_023442 [Phrynosoma platyrhinos]
MLRASHRYRLFSLYGEIFEVISSSVPRPDVVTILCPIQGGHAKKASKFRDWLDCSSMEIKPNAVAMEILAYLAYETVAQLVDLALLVKQEMTPKAGDPFSHAISATFIQYHSSAEMHAIGQTASMKPSPDSPENTPPPTPTPPSAGPQLFGKNQSGTMGNGSLGQESSKVKQRKRKKSTAACGGEAQGDAIQPAHIREAIRRYSNKIGPLSSYTLLPVQPDQLHYMEEQKRQLLPAIQQPHPSSVQRHHTSPATKQPLPSPVLSVPVLRATQQPLPLRFRRTVPIRLLPHHLDPPCAVITPGFTKNEGTHLPRLLHPEIIVLFIAFLPQLNLIAPHLLLVRLQLDTNDQEVSTKIPVAPRLPNPLHHINPSRQPRRMTLKQILTSPPARPDRL